MLSGVLAIHLRSLGLWQGQICQDNTECTAIVCSDNSRAEAKVLNLNVGQQLGR